MLASVAAASLIGALLYRLRGGWWRNLTGAQRWYNGTHMMRAIWALPTAGLIYALAGGPWWLMGALFVSVFASMALLGHGAHMIFDAQKYTDGNGTKTELLTGWWLPEVFGGVPDAAWAHSRVTAYNMAGMSFIGLIRNIIAMLPLFWFAPVPALIYATTGALHGPLYWLGWRLPSASSANGEYLVGGLSWFAIALLLG